MFYFIYLFIFIFGCVGSSLRHSGSSLQCAGFSLGVACGFSVPSCGARAPEHVDSVVCGTWAV